MTLDQLKRQVSDPDALEAQYKQNREHSQTVGCPVFNVFYNVANKPVAQVAFYTTRDELALTEEEARPLIEEFHINTLNQTN